MKKYAARGMNHAFWLLTFILLSVMPGGAAGPEPAGEILDRARALHGKLFPGLEAEEQAWVNEQARKLGLGQMDEGVWRSSLAPRRPGQAGDPEVLRLLVFVQSLAFMERQIARRQAERERILAEMREVAARIRGASSPPAAWLEQQASLSDQSTSISVKMRMDMERRSKFIATLSDILKKIGSTQETVAQNIK